jgi:hypothetical protein
VKKISDIHGEHINEGGKVFARRNCRIFFSRNEIIILQRMDC